MIFCFEMLPFSHFTAAAPLRALKMICITKTMENDSIEEFCNHNYTEELVYSKKAIKKVG